ncbi:minor tail protein [Mycobacterium phage LilSpotty]|uniref:Minor tail protein n=1 Tax=Mycobacterium phage LilSpotty TaxID=2588512 RepID=A0A4Y6EM08_9CAUD|nr:minor tail protein [Mycobacterium phage LilSpotty]QDF19748.1 minor tail protein [Mycobacterium phage LilSpotty]
MITNPFITQPDFFDRKIRGMWITGQGVAFHTHGDQAGAEGVWSAQGQVKGIYDAPVQTTHKAGAFQEGSTPKAVKWLHRDMTLGFHITETQSRSAEENESAFRFIFDYLPDEYEDEPEPTTLHIDTEMSGERRLDLLLSDTPVSDPDVDPMEQQYFNLILRVRANQPMWYELDPSTGKDYKTVFQSGATSGEGFIEVENPTDRPIKQKWVLTRATWRLPDVSWKGGKKRRYPGGVYGNRVIPMKPITAAQGGAVVSLDTAKDLMVRDAHYTNALAALLPNGMHFMHQIPPYTPKTLLPIAYTDAPAGGARAELIQPRRWSRPWGLE